MENVKTNKMKTISIVFIGLFLLVGSFFIYNLTGASSGDNEIKVSSAKFTKIVTGTGAFSDDGLNYYDETTGYTVTEGYTPGKDSNDSNRIVRSFDTLTYEFEFKIADKLGATDYDSRTVDIEVLLTPEEAKYVTFDADAYPGETTHTFSFDGIETYGPYVKEVTLYVLGAPNGMEIKPRFNIKESTDEEPAVSLGYVDGTTTYYSYEEGNYNETSDLMNYLPTVVSSVDGRVLVDIEPAAADSQKATYNGKKGRFITYVAGVYLEEDENYGLKGKTMPTGDITFNAGVTHTGASSIVQDSSWNRLYGEYTVGTIEPVVVSLPYSTDDSGRKQKEIQNPGSITTTENNGNLNVTISDYSIKYNFPTLNANDTEIGNKAYIGTYAFTVFSPRVTDDGMGDINATLSVSNLVAKTPNDINYATENASRTLVNAYYEGGDFNLKTDFVTEKGEKSLYNEVENGIGSLSKGDYFIYKTIFNHKETSSSEGLKEVIKVNNNAFRVVPFGDNKNITIEAKCGEEKCQNIDENSFDIKFVSGTFANANYELKEIDAKTSPEVKGEIEASCATIDLESLNPDQVMNLYGGPCIKAKENIETEYSNIVDAVDSNNKEVPITKVIVQTKEGVILPDEAEITVRVRLRVRNVQDLTRAYQATTIATTSDNDSVIRYFSPSAPYQVTDPNNYLVAALNGNTSSKSCYEVFGASLRIANYTTKQDITVMNKNKDGSTKINYNVVDNDTIIYSIKSSIEDYEQNVGADDVWYIDKIFVQVVLPSELTYIKDADMDKYLFDSGISSDGKTHLAYKIPFTKTNFEIPEIRFKSKIDPKINGAAKSIVVYSTMQALNVNDEVNSNMFGTNQASFEIFATGINNVIVEQQVGKEGTQVEKNGEFSYKLRAYNNTSSNITDYSFVNILPVNGDYLGSKFSGEYQVKVKLPESLGAARIKCSKQATASIVNEINNSKNTWEECNITEDYLDGITAIRVDNISIGTLAYTDYIELMIKPTNNNYSDVYNNRFIGGSETLSTTSSNIIGIKVVSRSISGNVFVDVDEDGVKADNDLHITGTPVTLYKLNGDEATKVAETNTDKDGNYIFKDLEIGRYYIDINYNSSKYDLTLRYATENTDLDSDAYVVDETKGLARISNKKIPDEPFGIRLSRDNIGYSNMDMGLISKQMFGFEMKKYITRIDLAYNGSINTTNYDNLSKVAINVRNSLNATAKVYYGISITNNGTKPGYVKEVQEDIPAGLIFDSSYDENTGWIQVDGKLKYTDLSDVVIYPGETKYLKIVLFMPTRQDAGTFLNTVSIVSMEEYVPVELSSDTSDVASTRYRVGESLSYAGLNWHVIGVENISNDEQNVTLFADGNQLTNLSHNSNPYRWSTSGINGYLNGLNNIKPFDMSALKEVSICDDASGLQIGSYGGSISGNCQSQVFVTSKIRLISIEEVTRLQNTLSNIGWLNSGSYWTQSSTWVTPAYTSFGEQTNSVAGFATSIENGVATQTLTSEEKDIRPVITISSKKILFE